MAGNGHARLSEKHRRWLLGYVFVAPVVLLTAVFSLVPLALLGYRSLFSGTIFNTNQHFIGIGNYTGALSGGGAHAFLVTAEYTVGFVVASMLAGLVLALLLNIRLPGLARLRAVFVVPLVVPIVATALIWGNLFAPQFGLVNRLLSGIGLPAPNWLSSPHLALGTVVLFGTWQFFGENVILYLAALKTVPAELTEAAGVDGAGPWARLRYIRLPLLRRATTLIWVITTLTGLQTFTQIYILTGGGPNAATQTALYYIYNEAFVNNNVGQADAVGVVLFVASIAITAIQLAALGRSEGRSR